MRWYSCYINQSSGGILQNSILKNFSSHRKPPVREFLLNKDAGLDFFSDAYFVKICGCF